MSLPKRMTKGKRYKVKDHKGQDFEVYLKTGVFSGKTQYNLTYKGSRDFFSKTVFIGKNKKQVERFLKTNDRSSI
jgi:hypothetical protein